MAPTKPSSNAKAASAGHTSPRGYRRQSGDAAVGPPGDAPAIGARESDFSERSWWMVDVEGDGSTQGATALVKRCMRAYCWDLPQARKILSAYRQFLSLKKTLGDWDATLLSPCHLVDQMWHQHILDNFNYYHDVILLCGHFVGHNPDGALDVAAKVQRDRFTRECLRQHFGEGYDAEIWDGAGEGQGGAQNNAGGNREQADGADDILGRSVNIPSNGDRTISLSVKIRGGMTTTFVIKRTQPLSVLFSAFASWVGVEVDDVWFYLRGDAICGTLTPTQLGLEDNDTIDAILCQTKREDPQSGREDTPVTIRVKDQTGEETMFKIKRSTQMFKVFKAYAARKGVETKSLRFLLNGEMIYPDETPATLDLEDEDQIDCILDQCGC